MTSVLETYWSQQQLANQLKEAAEKKAREQRIKEKIKRFLWQHDSASNCVYLAKRNKKDGLKTVSIKFSVYRKKKKNFVGIRLSHILILLLVFVFSAFFFLWLLFLRLFVSSFQNNSHIQYSHTWIEWHSIWKWQSDMWILWSGRIKWWTDRIITVHFLVWNEMIYEIITAKRFTKTAALLQFRTYYIKIGFGIIINNDIKKKNSNSDFSLKIYIIIFFSLFSFWFDSLLYCVCVWFFLRTFRYFFTYFLGFFFTEQTEYEFRILRRYQDENNIPEGTKIQFYFQFNIFRWEFDIWLR